MIIFSCADCRLGGEDDKQNIVLSFLLSTKEMSTSQVSNNTINYNIELETTSQIKHHAQGKYFVYTVVYPLFVFPISFCLFLTLRMSLTMW